MSIPLEEVQGLILRGYGMDSLRIFVLRIEQTAQTRQLLGEIPITSAEPWVNRPDFCVNIGCTFAGLVALGLPGETLASFPEEFRAGAVARAEILGDVGPSAPELWKGGMAGLDVHLLVILFARDGIIRDQQSQALRALWSGAVSEISVHDGDMLPGNVAHFGFRDGFSQPTIVGAPANPIPDTQPPAPAGEFLFGYESQFSQFSYPVPQPDQFGRNGSFLALRILAQDCAAFEKLMAEAPAKYGISGELLAAKMVGRWRNGVPLGLSPATDRPDEPISEQNFNNYDYADDARGQKCPMGSHMRRANPRNTPIAGDGGAKHRIVRRGLPYGPPFDPALPDDQIERGLLGIFIGVSLKDQFEFIMAHWVNDSVFAAGIAGTKDPVLGSVADGSGKFKIPMPGSPPIVVSGFSSFVRTRGSAYAFLPSIPALKFISALA